MELLAEKKKFLEQRQKELNELDQPLLTSTPLVNKTVTNVPQAKDSTSPLGQSQHSAIVEKRDPMLLSTSKKRHTSKFEAKTKQLVEEEGISFRKMLSQMKLEPVDTSSSRSSSSQSSLQTKHEIEDEAYPPSHNTDQSATIELQAEGPEVLLIPQEDKMWFMSDQDVPSHSIISTGKRNTSRKVHFAKEALILNAALEGEMNVLKDCIKEVSVIYQIMSIITCLYVIAWQLLSGQ